MRGEEAIKFLEGLAEDYERANNYAFPPRPGEPAHYRRQNTTAWGFAQQVRALVEALVEARDAWQDQLESDLEMCCVNVNGKPDESQMDEAARPMIEETRGLISRLNAALDHGQSSTEGGK